MSEQERLSRRERDRLRHKEEILTAALKLFSERGFHDVSMQQIAARAEFATGTLYKFFESKESLFDELVESYGERIISELQAVLDGPGDEVERLRRFIRHQAEMQERYAEFIKLYVSELGTCGAKLTRAGGADRLHSVMHTRMEQLIRSAMEKGLLRRVDPVIASKAIHSILETLAFEVAGHFDRSEAVDMCSKVEHLFLDGLLLPEGQHHD